MATTRSLPSFLPSCFCFIMRSVCIIYRPYFRQQKILHTILNMHFTFYRCQQSGKKYLQWHSQSMNCDIPTVVLTYLHICVTYTCCMFILKASITLLYVVLCLKPKTGMRTYGKIYECMSGRSCRVCIYIDCVSTQCGTTQ